MFVLAVIADTIRIPPHLLAQPTLDSVQTEIEKRYPNRIIVDVGLVVCPYGPPLEVGDGILVPGDGGAHHQVIFRCVVFRPFVDEVVVGTVRASHAGGLSVSVGGFFDHVFIPAYWMLNPSVYDTDTGLWVWTPTYDDDDDDDDDNGNGNDNNNDNEGSGGQSIVKREPEDAEAKAGAADGEGEEGGEGDNHFEIDLGAEIRFKVKAVNFTRVTTTMKGVQTTTTTTSLAAGRAGGATGGSAKHLTAENGGEAGRPDADNGESRRRGSSADLSDAANPPAPMQIMGSICEDGLGLISWWKPPEEEEEEEEGAEEEEEEEEEVEEDYHDP